MGAERCRMGQERRHFTDEFKRESVALLASSGRSLGQIAGELGISPSMLRNWRNRSDGRGAGTALHPNKSASTSGWRISPTSRPAKVGSTWPWPPALNSRPRKTLDWKTPAEALDQFLLSADKDRVATTA